MISEPAANNPEISIVGGFELLFAPLVLLIIATEGIIEAFNADADIVRQLFLDAATDEEAGFGFVVSKCDSNYLI